MHSACRECGLNAARSKQYATYVTEKWRSVKWTCMNVVILVKIKEKHSPITLKIPISHPPLF